MVEKAKDKRFIYTSDFNVYSSHFSPQEKYYETLWSCSGCYWNILTLCVLSVLVLVSMQVNTSLLHSILSHKEQKWMGTFQQGILKGEVSLYRWPPVWLFWISLKQKLSAVIQLIPNQSNRRSTVQWYFSFQYSLITVSPVKICKEVVS